MAPERRFLPATPERLSDAATDVSERTHSISSTAITSIGYNFISNEVTIQFTDGSTYVYSDVDLASYVGLARAGSHGEYFNENFRDNFSYQRVG